MQHKWLSSLTKISKYYTMKSFLEKSLYFSLFVQVISIATGLFGLTLQLRPNDQILTSTIGLETIVSTIQFSFYVWYAYHFNEVAEVAFYRYHDWFLTTPIMLFTMMLYYNYNNHPEKEETVQSFWENNRTNILIVLAFNAMMLFFGYLYEIRLLDLATSNTLGFIGLAGSFYVIYDSYVRQNAANLPLFIFFSVVWSLYGVAALFSPFWKNVFYNLIDTVSKNFYGIFLTYIAYQKKL
jgi:bacteriorhodopsin